MSRNEEFHSARAPLSFAHESSTAEQEDVDYYDMPEYLSEPGERLHHITAHRGDTEVGWLTLHPTGHVANIEVDPAHQRSGVATALWQEAQRSGLDPKHSGRFTPEGLAWARKVSGPGVS